MPVECFMSVLSREHDKHMVDIETSVGLHIINLCG